MINDEAKIRIAVASSRRDTNWHNTVISWGELKEKCKPVRTSETLGEYQTMTREERGNVKDVGGFVGGVLKADGNRKNDNLECRTLLTIDVDEATALPEKPNPRLAMIVHSTHSHTTEKPRYRVIVPLSRPCEPLEYSEVAHKMAEGIGLDEVDMTSCEPVRLMYWASAPKDAPILYHAQDGEPLDVDFMLKQYKDWTDLSEWPTKDKPGIGAVSGAKQRKAVAGARQEPPREKKNIIGSWCRTFDVYHVLNEVLSGLYVSAGLNRFTYASGSSFGGVAVYDDGDFFYSYHATDPLGGRLLNSWDLTRLALFGHLDKEVAPTTRIDRRPSYQAMQKYALGIPEVSRDYLKYQLAAAREGEPLESVSDEVEEVDVEAEAEAVDDSWLDELEITEKGATVPSLHNFYTILRNDPNLIKGRVVYDEFKRDKVIVRPLEWEREEGDLWTDADTAQVALYIEKVYKIKNKNDLQMMLDAVVREDAFRENGVRKFILREKWDGVPRVDTLFMKYLGVADTPLNRKMSRRSLVACVARAFDPGCKFDQIIVFVGEQGVGKSSLLRKIAGGGRYFMESFSLDTKSNKMQEAVVGSWIIEIPELEGFYKADMNTIKSFVSKQSDEFRPAYAREKVSVKRTCVFFATTNDDEFLRDSTGNRRFWVMRCGVPERDVFDLTDEDVAQVWAEAFHLYKEGKTPLYLDRNEARELAELQKEFDSDNDQIGALEAFLDLLLPIDWHTFEMEERRAYFEAQKRGVAYIRDPSLGFKSIGTEKRNEVSAVEVVNEFFGMDNGKGNRQSRIANDLLKKLDGWEMMEGRKSVTGGYGRQKVFKRL